ncbi:MAG: hypothetical protein K940chlam3_00663 [Chlamydiae bacterium]|nr:hypothetical protein [Chlamydiota bacterium]
MNEFIILLIIVFWGWVSSYFAQQRGRNPYGWFFLGFLFGPFSLVALFIMKDYSQKTAPPETPGINVSHHSPFDHLDWYYLDSSRQTKGPISFEDLKKSWKEEGVNENTLVWYDSLSDWKKVVDISELKEELNADYQQ